MATKKSFYWVWQRDLAAKFLSADSPQKAAEDYIKQGYGAPTARIYIVKENATYVYQLAMKEVPDA